MLTTAVLPVRGSEPGVTRLPVIDKQDIRFTRLSSGGEFLNRQVLAIAQDNQGFMWFATNGGLYRYDGYSLTAYRHDPADPNTVNADNIMTIVKDRNGILWIGSGARGLDRLDPASGRFVHYRHQSGVEGSLSSDMVNCIYQDRSSALWIGTGGGLDRLDLDRGAFVHYRHDPADAASLTNDEIQAIYEDRQANLWVGTSRGLNRLDRASGRVSRFLHDSRNPRSLGDDFISFVLQDRTGTLWVGSPKENALSVLDVKAGEFTHYSFHTEPLSPMSVTGATSMHEDADGALWLSTVQDGLLKLDRERKQFVRYLNDPSNPASLHDNSVETIYEDAEGMIWAGTKSGVTRFSGRPPAFVNYTAATARSQGLEDDTIWSVQADRKGFLWIGTSGGVYRLDRNTGHFSAYQHDPRNPYSISHDTVSAISEDPSGRLWFGTYGGGLNWLDQVTGRFYAFRPDPKRTGGLSSDLVHCLLVDHEGTLWVGTSLGLNRYDPRTQRFKTYRHDHRDPHSLSSDMVVSLYEDRARRLWVGIIGGDLDSFDRNSEQFTPHPFNAGAGPGATSGAIHEDRDGTLWVGERDGLYRLQPSSGSFTRFTMSDGLPDNSVSAILEDRRGDLWLGTHYGISHFSPHTRRFRNYSALDGLPENNFNPYGMEAACRLPSGEMVFGSTEGFTIFDPDRITDNPFRPPVVLTDFLLFNKPVRMGEDSPLKRPIWATDSLTLNHNQSIFTLEFAALSYAMPRKNRYRYRLEGLENNWNDVDSTRRLATYSNLPAGRYTFRVQGSNNDQLWNETGVRLGITVLPPWWGTWWFSSMAGLCAAGVVFTAVRFRVRGLEQAAATLELQVRQRTSELETAKNTAEAANRTKSAFLAHMSHELRSPLNAILGYARLLRDGDVSDKQRADLDILHRSGEHLLTLINDLLDIARIEAGRAKAEIAPCDLSRLGVDITGMMRVRATAKNLELRLVENDEVPGSVQTDGPKVRQILVNLLGNAIKHTETGSVTLRLEARPGADAGHVLLIFKVEDTGIGIAAEDRERIFEPFVQVGNPRSHTGTGLGLAISRQFARLLGGEIHVASAPGEGSVFRLELPAKLAEQAEAPAEERRCVLDLAPGEAAPRILVVDDEAENREVLRRLLENAGFTAELAANGVEALEKFQGWRPQFIWMDLRMPVMDGREAARRIRGLPGGREVKIAAATASAYASDRTQVLAEGMDDFVLKPYRPSAIFECMARLLGVRYRAERVQAAAGEAAAILRPEALATLPNGLRGELREAVVSLDAGRIAEVIERISQTDAALGAVLARHAKRRAYTAIFNAIEATEKEPA